MVITILIKHPRPKFSTCFLDLIIMEKFKAHFKSAAGILMAFSIIAVLCCKHFIAIMMNVLPLLHNFLYLTSNEKKTDSTWDRLFL